ncbi:SMI1/KNR4 family protein [Streptomyces sp. NPDC058470]|uniref:SMI1/KNR4 family protein n=1 Tax=Streptomyces sp. NPDC058470 TaxID=3346515 RepID=UPI0036555089
MEFEDFAAHFADAQARNAALEIANGMKAFESLRATEADLDRAEVELGVQLPRKYREFMQRYGGGMFDYVELLPVVSLDGASDDLLSVSRCENFGSKFVAVAPVGTGDWWGFEALDGTCQDHVSFIYHENGNIEYEAEDFLTFVAKRGLQVGGV